MKKIILSALSLGAMCFLNACYYDNFKELHPQPAACDTTNTVTYSADVNPLLIITVSVVTVKEVEHSLI